MSFFPHDISTINAEFVNEQNKINAQVSDSTARQVKEFDDVRKPLEQEQEISVFNFQKDME